MAGTLNLKAGLLSLGPYIHWIGDGSGKPGLIEAPKLEMARGAVADRAAGGEEPAARSEAGAGSPHRIPSGQRFNGSA